MTSTPEPNNVTPLTPQVSANIERVTPEVARTWLGLNTRNRHVRPSQVTKYSRNMSGEQWKFTGETIKFAADGKLLDGQHRLRALIDADVSVDMLIVRGLDNDAQDVMDTGAARRAGDALAIHGKHNAQALASSAKLGFLLADDRPSRATKNATSHADIYTWIENNPEIEAAVNRVASGDLRNNIRIAVSVLGYCYYRLSQVDSKAAEEFFVALATGANLSLGNPILTLINRLNKIAFDRKSLTSNEAIWLVFRTWSAWRAGEKLSRLILPDEITKFPTVR